MKMFAVLFAFMLCFESTAFAEPVGKAFFHAEGLGLALDCDGVAENVSAEGVKVEGGKLVAGKYTVKSDAFKTGMGLRDTHLQELLKAKQNPNLEFAPALPLELKDGAPFSGVLKIAGVTKKVNGKLSLSGKKATFAGPVKLSDFGMKPPEWQGTTIADLVEVRVEVNVP